ncbi:hypothetical protein ANCCAN_01183 [Ancylostoma caninum]|uniref:W02B3.4-like N-terminal domain-containing protein n=1 Tax=Ancylostoma caninum TaxID=29170 RepID=A0A368H8B2_ANCCA|nr:hypothetical protein ANCCAN_01183 [Ancylostoma caninum]
MIFLVFPGQHSKQKIVGMRLLRIVAAFLCTIFVSVLFVFKSHRAGEEVLSLHFQQEEATTEVNCTELLNELNPRFPAVLIDMQLLRSLQEDNCRSGKRAIRVAVDVQHLNNVRQADFPEYNILYYDKPRDKNFLLFFDTESRILPRYAAGSDVF